MSQKVTLTLEILPYCNHPKFVKDCRDCRDAQLVYVKIRNMQEETKHNRTKVQILSGTNGNKLEK